LARRRRLAGLIKAPPVAVDPLLYCREKVAGPGSALAYTLLFCEPALRSTLTAVYALEAELREIAEHGRDPGVGRARTAWWAEELAAASRGQPSHPVTQALTSALPGGALGRVGLAGALEAIATHANHANQATHANHGDLVPHAALSRYAHAVGGASARLAALAGRCPAPRASGPGCAALGGARLLLEISARTAREQRDTTLTNAAVRAATAAHAGPPAALRLAVLDQLVLLALALDGARGTAPRRAPRRLWVAWRAAVQERRRAAR
jgi:hypothetical protein